MRLEMIGLGRMGANMVRRLLKGGSQPIDEAVPVPVLSTALYQRFSSRGESAFQDKRLSAMRFELGGHVEKPAGN